MAEVQEKQNMKETLDTRKNISISIARMHMHTQFKRG